MTALSSLLTVNAQINALSLAPINSLVLWLEVSGLKKDGLILSLRTQQPQNPDVVKEGGLDVGEGRRNRLKTVDKGSGPTSSSIRTDLLLGQ